jgi:hypothetical protein
MISSGRILRYLRWSVALIVTVMERFVFDFHSSLSINVFIWNPLEKVEPVWFMWFAKHSLAPRNEPELTILFPRFYLPHQSKLICMFENTLDHHEHTESAIQWISISLTCQFNETLVSIVDVYYWFQFRKFFCIYICSWLPMLNKH